jgi:outer membrane protein assembly factor BamB
MGVGQSISTRFVCYLPSSSGERTCVTLHMELTVNFCIQCKTYLASDVAFCPTCGAPRPQAESIATFWSTDLGQPPAGPPLVVGDLLLVSTQEPGPPAHRSMLRALSLADGSPRWQKSFEYAQVSGLAAVQTSEVLETSEVLVLVAITSTDLMRGEGALVALDATGEEHWRWAPGVQRVSAPAVAGDVACVTADTRMLLVLDLATGDERARVELEASASLDAPALVGDFAIIPCRGPHVLAVGLDGKTRWRFDAEAPPDAWLDETPVIVGKHLFAVLSTGAVLALRAEGGSLAWRVDVGPAGKRLSAPATDGEQLYVGARDGLHALDLADGHEVWAFSTERRIEAASLVVGGVVYATCHDHHLYALDAATGRELWRYEVGRRIEVPPVVATCGEPPTPCVLVADRGGTLTTIARPLSAAEHEAAGHWVEAASAYAAMGQLAHGAELLETHGEPFKAAELWKIAGERECAAVQYEAAGAWQQATALWSALGRPLKQAEALEQHARSLEDRVCSDEERATAWAAAAQALETEGEPERAATCWQEVARCLRQPVITLDVKHEGLVLDAWSRLQFIVRNEGYGSARKLSIRASGDQFEGQVTATRQIATLRPGRERTDQLDVRPLQHGDSVPLRVSVEYQDQAGEPCTCEQTIYIPVARIEADRGGGQVFHITTAGGAVVFGGVTVEDGDFVGRDAVAVADVGAPVPPTLPATTHVLSFDRLSPADFERLCLWLVEREGYTKGEHLGLAGGEQGRDVVAYKLTTQGEELWYFQCKRYRSINVKTLTDEVDKYLQLIQEKPDLRPAGVVFVISCAVSARVREEVGVHCEQHGLAYEFWALTELDMRVKRHPDLLKEFFNLGSPSDRVLTLKPGEVRAQTLGSERPLQVIKFDYLPESPFEHGWEPIEGHEQVQFLAIEDPNHGRVMRIKAEQDFCIDYHIGVLQQMCKAIGFVVRSESNFAFYAEIRVRGQQGVIPDSKLLYCHIIEGSYPEQHPRYPNEYEVHVPVEQLGNGWVRMKIDLPQEVQEVAKVAGEEWEFDRLLMLRLKGSRVEIDCAHIELYKENPFEPYPDHEESSPTTEMATLEEDAEQVPSEYPNKRQTSQLKIDLFESGRHDLHDREDTLRDIIKIAKLFGIWYDDWKLFVSRHDFYEYQYLYEDHYNKELMSFLDNLDRIGRQTSYEVRLLNSINSLEWYPDVDSIIETIEFVIAYAEENWIWISEQWAQLDLDKRRQEIPDFGAIEFLKNRYQVFLKTIRGLRLQANRLRTSEAYLLLHSCESVDVDGEDKGGLAAAAEWVLLKKELAQHKRNLYTLREQAAIFAAGETPLHLLNQINAEEEEIRRIEVELERLER